jgi:D-glycero-D-manno-heptose 1,7-bisphosphate phosphatase
MLDVFAKQHKVCHSRQGVARWSRGAPSFAAAAPAERPPAQMPQPAAFLDRDGVINVDHGYTWRRENFAFVAGTLPAAARLHGLGFALVVVTNQSGIGRGLYTEADFHALTDWMKQAFAGAGAPLAGVYWCPHHPTDAAGAYRRQCGCRKPAPGMLLEAIRELDLDPARSLMFGDKRADLEAAAAAGVGQRILLGHNGVAAPDAADARGLATAVFACLAAAVDALAPRLSQLAAPQARA